MTGERWAGSLRTRLTAAFVGVALTAIAVLGGLAVVGARSGLEDLVQAQHQQTAGQVTAVLAQAYGDAGGWTTANLMPAFAAAALARAELVVLGEDGQTVGALNPRMRAMMERVRGGAASPGADELGPVRAVPVRLDGRTVGTAELRFPTAPLDPEQQVGRALTRTLIGGAALAAVVALTVALAVSARLTRPVVALTGAARRFGAGERGARVGMPRAAGELGELAAAFDQMAERLELQDRLRRSMVADVAHELRTPVAILRASCEEMVDGLAPPTAGRISSLHDEVLRLGRVVEDLESLASAQAAALSLRRTTVDLRQVVTQAAALLDVPFADAGLDLILDATTVTVDADPDRLHQVALNLLSNALKFTPSGGRVSIAVQPAGEWARFTVSDTGPGLAPDDLSRIFQRFWRGPNSAGAPGSGIGLAVVAELVQAHGGTVTADSPSGGGTTFTVRLPRTVAGFAPCRPGQVGRRG